MTTTYAQNWQPVSASVTFNVKMLGVAINGSFKNLAASVVFDPANPSAGQINASLDTKTLFTDNKLRDRHLQEKEEFFEVIKFPNIKIKSTKIQKEGTAYVGWFDLTIKSITKQVKIPFTFVKENTPKGSSNGKFEGAFVINRKDWKVGGSTLGMSSDVSINVILNVEPK
jgi:polyisoprenoid-binding protein YceI